MKGQTHLAAPKDGADAALLLLIVLGNASILQRHGAKGAELARRMQLGTHEAAGDGQCLGEAQCVMRCQMLQQHGQRQRRCRGGVERGRRSGAAAR